MARAKKKESLTPRQRQSQRIMREKTAKLRRQVWQKRILHSVMVLAGLTVVVGGIWMWQTGVIARGLAQATDELFAYTARSGYALDALYLEGRNRTPLEEVEKAIGVKKGDPILRVSLSEVKARLEAIGSIRFAAVERELPGTLSVRIIEREPVALWQQDGKLVLIDDKGVSMNDLAVSDYPHLPLIVGSGAPLQVTDIVALLAAEPELKERFVAAVRVSDRRWNIRLTGGVEVKLPEQEPEKAWKRLADLHRQQKLLDRQAQVIDLRVQGKLFITVSPENMPGYAANAKDT